MPFPVYVPFYPGLEPSRLLSREANAEHAHSSEYFAEAGRMISARVFAEELPREGWIVDAGCGGGRWVHFARQLGCRVLAVDWHPPVLRRVRADCAGVPVLAADVARLPLKSCSVAGVISLGVVEHDPAGPRAMLAELARVLAPRGTLLLSVPYSNVLRRALIHPRYRWSNNRMAGKGCHFVEYRFSRRELGRLLSEAGFVVKRFVPHEFVPPRNMGLVADRNMLAIRFVAKPGGGWELELPEWRGWELTGAWAALVRALWALSPWSVAGEILAVARKAG